MPQIANFLLIGIKVFYKQPESKCSNYMKYKVLQKCFMFLKIIDQANHLTGTEVDFLLLTIAH